jgi:peptidyl-prolyl cis-trans isomerase D
VGLAFSKTALNKVSAPIDGNSGVFVIKPEMVGAKVSVAPGIDEQRKQMEQQLKQSVAYTAISALRKAANIKDKRSKFL